MENKNIMKEIEGNWNYERCIKPEHVDYLIEQNKNYREFIHSIAKELHFEGDSKLDTQNKLIRIILNARRLLGSVPNESEKET